VEEPALSAQSLVEDRVLQRKIGILDYLALTVFLLQ